MLSFHGCLNGVVLGLSQVPYKVRWLRWGWGVKQSQADLVMVQLCRVFGKLRV